RQSTLLRRGDCESALDIDLLCLENYGSSSGDYLTDAARSEAAPDGNSRSILPLLQLKEALNDEGEVLRKILDGSVNYTRGFRFTLQKQIIKFGFAKLFRIFIT